MKLSACQSTTPRQSIPSVDEIDSDANVQSRVTMSLYREHRINIGQIRSDALVGQIQCDIKQLATYGEDTFGMLTLFPHHDGALTISQSLSYDSRQRQRRD